MKQSIAILDGRTVRKFVNHLKKLGADVAIDRPIHKLVNTPDGQRLFSALKYSSGWDCRVADIYINDLKKLF